MKRLFQMCGVGRENAGRLEVNVIVIMRGVGKKTRENRKSI